MIPLSHLKGTPFQKRIWRELLTIPFGKTRSYRDIAQAIGSPRSSRAVANAVGSTPLPVTIPCHRVIYSNGTLGANGTLGGYRWGIEIKKTLLTFEGSYPL